MKLRPGIVALLASLLATTSFAAKTTHNECLAHWEDHIFEDRMQMGGCNLTDADMLELSQIVYKRHLKYINLRNNDFTAAGLKNLAKYDNGTIKLLWLNENNLNVDAVNALKDFYALDVVSLSNNPLGDDGVLALAANRRLNEVYLNHTGITSLAAINALAKSNLEVLSVRNNKLTDDMIQPLSLNTMIKVLSVANNEIGAAGAEHLSKNKVITELYLGKNHIGDNGIASFANNSTLQLLNAQWNNIGKAGIFTLANNLTLKKINIAHNAIDDDALAKLAQNSNIIYLDASYTNLGHKALVSIVDNIALKSLFIDGNNINDADAKLLALSEIKLLSANNNSIGVEGGKALALDTTLKQLYINKNHVGDPAALEFAKNTTLATLYIMYNGLTQVGMNALSDNIHFDVVWYGETPGSIKKINRHPTEHGPFMADERLIKSTD